MGHKAGKCPQFLPHNPRLALRMKQTAICSKMVRGIRSHIGLQQRSIDGGNPQIDFCSNREDREPEAEYAPSFQDAPEFTQLVLFP